MLGADIDTWSTIADGTFIGSAAVAGFSSAQWADLIAGANDDAQWVILALWKMADYKSARGLPNVDLYLVSVVALLLRNHEDDIYKFTERRCYDL